MPGITGTGISDVAPDNAPIIAALVTLLGVQSSILLVVFIDTI